MADYDEYKMTTSVDVTPEGKTVTRTLDLRADTEADALAHTDCPSIGDTLTLGAETAYCKHVRAEHVSEVGSDAADDFLWEVEATYATLTSSAGSPRVAGKASWKLSFRPVSVHINNVEDETDQLHYGPGYDEDGVEEAYDEGAEEHPRVKTGINVTDEGAQGADFEETQETLMIDFFQDPDDLETFLETVRGLKDRVNDDDFTGPWGTYEAGEARLSGVEIGQTKGEVITVSVEFAIRANTNTTGSGGNAPDVFLDSLDDTVEVPKKGHEYAWVRFLKSTSTDDDTETRTRSIDAHVATHYKEGDFDELAITEDMFS